MYTAIVLQHDKCVRMSDVKSIDISTRYCDRDDEAKSDGNDVELPVEISNGNPVAHSDGNNNSTGNSDEISDRNSEFQSRLPTTTEFPMELPTEIPSEKPTDFQV